MAKIIKDEKQVRAIEKINRELDEIKNINLVLEGIEFGSIGIIFDDDSQAKRKTTRVNVDTADKGKIEGVLTSQKKRLVKDITKQAKDNRIELEEDELKAMADTPKAQK